MAWLHRALPGTRGLAGNESRLPPTPVRVLIRDADLGEWRAYGDFQFPGEAEACFDALKQRGIEARLEQLDRLLCAVS